LRRISARVLANRANARASTGPKTRLGKARSSRNAITHGLAMAAPPSNSWEDLADIILGRSASPNCYTYARQIEFAIFQLERVDAAKHAAFLRCLESGKTGDLVDDLYQVEASLAAKVVTEMKRFQRYEAQANSKLMRAISAWKEFLAEQDAVEPPEASDLSTESFA
jgi:hypothetical protein